MAIDVSDNFKKFAQHCVRRPVVDVSFDFHDEFESVNCDLLTVAFTQQADSPISSVVKSFADVTVSNADGKYSQYLDLTLSNCDDELVETLENKDIRPGMELTIDDGFLIPDGDCDHCNNTRDTVRQFTGKSERFPAYTTVDNGRSLAQFHFVDGTGELAGTSSDVDVDYSGFTVGEALQDWFANNFAGNTLNVPDNGAILLPDPFIIEANKPFSDYLKNMIDLNGGRFYQRQDGQFHYDTHAQVNDNNVTADFVFDTCNHIIDTTTPSLNDIYNAITVQQFTNPGGIEYTAINEESIARYGRREFTLTNPLVDSVATARAIAERTLAFYEDGAFEREITVVGLGWLEVYDVVQVRERVKSRPCENCMCETLYSETIYRIKKIYSQHSPQGYTQKYTLVRSPLSLNQFIFCDSSVCDPQFSVAC